MDLSLRRFKIYVAGPYESTIVDDIIVKTRDEHLKTTREWSIQLWEDGFSVMTPHLNTIKFDEDCKCEWQDYIKGDLEWISVCDGLFLLPNWGRSSGASVEIRHALGLNKPIFEYTEYLLMKEYFDHRLYLMSKSG